MMALAAIVAIQMISSRPVYRRGGIQFGTVPLTFTKGSDELSVFDPENLLEILADPVIRVLTSEDGENFTDLKPEDRLELIQSLTILVEARAHEAAAVDLASLAISDDVNAAAQAIPESAGSDPDGAPVVHADQTKEGEGGPNPSVETSTSSTTAAVEGGNFADGNAQDAQAAPMVLGAVDVAGAKKNNGGVDPTPAPVAAPKPKK
jgi:hypothetical protein